MFRLTSLFTAEDYISAQNNGIRQRHPKASGFNTVDVIWNSQHINWIAITAEKKNIQQTAMSLHTNEAMYSTP
jgi:hypothetical protein